MRLTSDLAKSIVNFGGVKTADVPLILHRKHTLSIKAASIAVCVTCNCDSRSSQVTCGVRKMNFPAAADAAYLVIFFATAWTTVVTGVTRPHARTAPPSPAGRLTPACPRTRCAMGNPTAKTGGTNLGSFAVRLGRVRRLLPRVRRQSFSAETGSASARPGGVTTPQTAPMAATRTTVVSDNRLRS